MKRIFILLLLTLCVITLTHCGRRHSDDRTNHVRIGTIAGPETKLVEMAKSIAAERYDLEVEIVQFTDYVLPNQALADGSIDANMF